MYPKSYFHFCTIISSYNSNITHILPRGLKTKQQPQLYNKGLLGIISDLHQTDIFNRLISCIHPTQMVLHLFHNATNDTALSSQPNQRISETLRPACGCSLTGGRARTRGTSTSVFSEAAEEACSQFSLVAGE